MQMDIDINKYNDHNKKNMSSNIITGVHIIKVISIQNKLKQYDLYRSGIYLILFYEGKFSIMEKELLRKSKMATSGTQ